MPFLLINKPAGITSHDVVDKVRKITGERTVGHAGTLDPFATGLLIIGVGRESTKHLNTFLGMPKTYKAVIRLGASSTTLDPEGTIEDASMNNGTPIEIQFDAITTAIKSLTGDLLQIPPMHSAIKINGQKLYELARQGIEINRPPRPITIYNFTLLTKLPTSFSLPQDITAIINCSSGTYIRSIARDLGQLLNTQAYLTTLSRTAIGSFSLNDALNLPELNSENWHNLAKNLLS